MAQFLKDKNSNNELKKIGQWTFIANLISMVICLSLLVTLDLVTNFDTSGGLTSGYHFMNDHQCNRTDGLAQTFPQLVKVSSFTVCIDI